MDRSVFILVRYPSATARGLERLISLQVWRLVPTPCLRTRRRYAEVLFKDLPWSARPAPGSRTRRLNRETGSTQCRLGKVPPHNWARPPLPGACRWGFAVPTKNGPPQGVVCETGGASSPQLKLGASALALGEALTDTYSRQDAAES